MEQQGYLRTFRERWIAIVLAVLAGVGVAYNVGQQIAPIYSATATLFLTVASEEATFYERSAFSLQRIGSYPDLIHSQEVLRATIDDLGLDMTVQELSENVSASAVATTVLLEVTAEAATAELAAEIANTVATNLAAEVASLENSDVDLRYSIALELRVPAVAPVSPIAPQNTVILGIGVVGGLALGLIAAILWAKWDTTIRSVALIRRISGLPVIGELPRSPLFGRPTGARGQEKARTAFRDIQLTIRQTNAGRVPDILLLAPASQSAGGFSVRRGFAYSLAQTGREVLLVETDVDRRSSISGSTTAGLAEVLAGTHSLSDVIGPVDEVGGYWVLGAGARDAVPKEYLAEQRMPQVAKALVAKADVTVIQTTSVTRPASLQLVGPYVDGVVVLVRFGRTRIADLAHMLAQLRLIGLRPLGVVLVGVPALWRSDLAATWLPEDFAAEPRTPLIPFDERMEQSKPGTKPRASRTRRTTPALAGTAAPASPKSPPSRTSRAPASKPPVAVEPEQQLPLEEDIGSSQDAEHPESTSV